MKTVSRLGRTTFVDPDGKRPKLVLAPNFYEAIPSKRACYYLSRTKHKEIFDGYWRNYEHAFDMARSR